MTSVVVKKSRRMVADELAFVLKVEAWEQRELRKLRRPTLIALATSIVPGFSDRVIVEL